MQVTTETSLSHEGIMMRKRGHTDFWSLVVLLSLAVQYKYSSYSQGKTKPSLPSYRRSSVLTQSRGKPGSFGGIIDPGDVSTGSRFAATSEAAVRVSFLSVSSTFPSPGSLVLLGEAKSTHVRTGSRAVGVYALRRWRDTRRGHKE